MKWLAKAMSTLKTAKWCPLVPFSPQHNTQLKQLNPWPNHSSASCVVNYSRLPACQKGEGAILRPPEHLWISDKPQEHATAKAACMG